MPKDGKGDSDNAVDDKQHDIAHGTEGDVSCHAETHERRLANMDRSPRLTALTKLPRCQRRKKEVSSRG